MISTCAQCALAHEVEVLAAAQVAERKDLKMTWLAGGIVNDTDETSVITFDGVISAENKAELMRVIRKIDNENKVDVEDPDPSYFTECCNCGAQVDTREVEDGGGEHGAEISDSNWVCSPECWDVVK